MSVYFHDILTVYRYSANGFKSSTFWHIQTQIITVQGFSVLIGKKSYNPLFFYQMESTRCMISNGLRNSSPKIHSCRSIQIVRYSYKKKLFQIDSYIFAQIWLEMEVSSKCRTPEFCGQAPACYCAGVAAATWEKSEVSYAKCASPLCPKPRAPSQASSRSTGGQLLQVGQVLNSPVSQTPSVFTCRPLPSRS